MKQLTTKFLLILIVITSFSKSQDHDIIIEDTWDPLLDKLSHASTSFGCYYTLRYYQNSKFESALYTALIGLSFEIYQINDPNELDSDFRGISLHDLGYNFIGIGFALGLDIVVNHLRENLFKNSRKNSKSIVRYNKRN